MFLSFGVKDNTTMFSCHSAVLDKLGFLLGVRKYIGFLLLPTAGEGRRGELATVSLVALCVLKDRE